MSIPIHLLFVVLVPLSTFAFLRQVPLSTSCVGHQSSVPFAFSLRSSSYNPNDNETPEERRKRMDLVRQIQANFYQDENQNDEEKWVQADPSDPAILYNLPLWRVQWIELPGYQNVLNVHVPHYTHMFQRLLRQGSQPLFGHVYLEEGSKNLGNPDFFLPESEPLDDDDSIPDKEESIRMATKVTQIGTLMQITDYVEQEDGTLTLIVQGISPIKILAASQQVPYAIASKVQIIPDKELYSTPLQDSVTDVATNREESTAYLSACKSMIVEESKLLRDVEYHRTTFGRQDDSDRLSFEGVSPLSNVNGSVVVDFNEIKIQKRDCFQTRLSHEAEISGNDALLLATTTMVPPTDDKNCTTTYLTDGYPVTHYERNVWIQLDQMIQLLEKAQPGLRIPVPSQLLGLLPIDAEWPSGFRLEEYAEKLDGNDKARVGTFSKSPFVRLSRTFPEYPPMRRAGRLSYAVWLLLDSIAIGGEKDLDRKQELLETPIICERLQKAIDQLSAVNFALQSMLE